MKLQEKEREKEATKIGIVRSIDTNMTICEEAILKNIGQKMAERFMVEWTKLLK